MLSDGACSKKRLRRCLASLSREVGAFRNLPGTFQHTLIQFWRKSFRVRKCHLMISHAMPNPRLMTRQLPLRVLLPLLFIAACGMTGVFASLSAESSESAGFVAPRSVAKHEIVPYWPKNNSFVGETTETFLYKGQRIDRYGGGDWSRFFSPQGTPDFARALPPGTAGQPLRTFEVVKPFPVQSGQVAPAFGQMGGGTQMVSPVNLKTLLDKGILKEVTP